MTEITLKDVAPSLFKKRGRVLRPAEVFKLVGLSGATVWRLRRQGNFPSPIRLSPNRIGWPEEVIAEWLANRPQID